MKILLVLASFITFFCLGESTTQTFDSSKSQFYTGNLLDRPGNNLFYTGEAEKKKPKVFFKGATKTSYSGLTDKMTDKRTRYFLFPMQIQADQHVTFKGTMGNSKRVIELKDQQLLDAAVTRQQPIVSGTLTLYHGTIKSEMLIFKGNTMQIIKYPDDALPAFQTCENKICCLQINLGQSTPGISAVTNINLHPGVCAMEEDHPKIQKTAPKSKPTVHSQPVKKQIKDDSQKGSQQRFLNWIKKEWVNINP